jgi:cytochrome bd-type quinol oxidase subunit 2
MAETTPLLPAWLVLPMAVLTLLVLGGQFWAISTADMDAQRRRLRQATTFLMMVLTPLAAYGFAIAMPARGREYVIVWVLIAALLFMVILLALLDMLHSMRIHREQMSRVRRQLAQERARDVAAALAAAKAHGASGRRPSTPGEPDHG